MTATPATVEAFNALPRPQTLPTGESNHWVFGVRHTGPGNCVFLVNPATSSMVASDISGQIFSLPSAAEKAKAIIPLLLDSFVMMHTHGVPGEVASTAETCVAPWSWSCEDATIAHALSHELQKLQLNRDLFHVGTATSGEMIIFYDRWTVFLSRSVDAVAADPSMLDAAMSWLRTHLTTAATPFEQASASTATSEPRKVCNKCGSPATPPKQLKTCSRCRITQYCCRDCQRADWKLHKPKCGQWENGMDPDQYYNNVAHAKEDAQALASSLNIKLPRSGSASPTSLMSCVRRIVVTGNDVPDKIRLLFGPRFTEKDFPKAIEEARLTLLMDPPRSSPNHAYTAPLDADVPFWAPRPASTEEQEQLRQMREIQVQARRMLHCRKAPDNAHMALLNRMFGSAWWDKPMLHAVACSSMGDLDEMDE